MAKDKVGSKRSHRRVVAVSGGVLVFFSKDTNLGTEVKCRDNLIGKIPGAFAHAFDFTDHMDIESQSENDDEDINELRKGLVAIKLSKYTKKRIRERWCKAVIVKLVGRLVSFSYMQSKLNQIWKPEGRMDIMDLSHGFFLVRFFSKEDLNFVLR
ncbi:hypothetical protein SO802_007149 [Lithocarpus litseifolius]|uniref:DUF4283 domain-containing protein n=1 Tax=Lithocarpus litseifolius TaxID=425828 RepID=A0AAW2DNP2_9ROSI